MVNTSTKTATTDPVLGRMELNDHEQVLFCHDRPTGLKAIIAIHDTTLGPALGGTRMWPYASEAEALNDVMRLSRGMTYKSSLAGLDLGGGKAVIIGDSRTQKTEAMFRRFGQFVDSLNGRYITAEDVGMSTTEMVNIQKETKNVAGLPEEMGGSGDPSPVTAYGVYCGLKAAAKTAYGTDDLSGRKVAVQGAGNVGRGLVGHLVKDGAKVFLTDIHDEKLAAIKAEYPSITLVKPEDIYDLDMDIYSPCALGATVNDDTLKRLKCSVIAGAANNQLADESLHGKAVMEKGILYAPDFLINAGGIINCSWERRGYNRKAALLQTEEIHTTALRIFKASADLGIPTYLAANQAAEHRITSLRQAAIRLLNVDMLNRRYLRIKAFQSLYAYWQSDNASAARIEKELFTGIERTYDLYLSLLLVFGELLHVAELIQEERKKKHLPTAEDLTPNLRFVDNPVLRTIAQSDRLRIECEKRKISWVGNHELFTTLYRELESNELFMAYMQETQKSFKRDQGFILQLFTEVIANHEALQEVYEGRSITWLEDLDLAASLVKRTVEQMRESDAADLAMSELIRESKEDNEFVSTLFRKTIEFGEEHEKAIAEKSANWESDRIALSDMILMQMALTEVRIFDQIPVKVTLNEYIEIAKAYSTPKSKNFINGVLDKLFVEMRADGRIHKVGRGLLES